MTDPNTSCGKGTPPRCAARSTTTGQRTSRRRKSSGSAEQPERSEKRLCLVIRSIKMSSPSSSSPIITLTGQPPDRIISALKKTLAGRRLFSSTEVRPLDARLIHLLVPASTALSPLGCRLRAALHAAMPATASQWCPRGLLPAPRPCLPHCSRFLCAKLSHCER